MGSLVSVSILFYIILLCVFALSSPFKLAWVERPPYTTKHLENRSTTEFKGILYDILKKKVLTCGYFETVRVKYENDILEKLKSGEVQGGGPLVVKGKYPSTYEGSSFVDVLEYSGADFIIKEKPKKLLETAANAMFSTWPLLAITLILTMIAGIIIWALDTVINPQEFPRSFFRGSWEGFWWAFISMTTVGYGDKSPRSIPSRIFAVIWIHAGVIAMAFYTSVITTALTSVTLGPETTDIYGSTVAVLGNGTEYQLALESGAKPKVFDTFKKMMDAFESDEVTGILVDRISGYYYLSQDGQSNRTSTVTSDHIPLTAGVGFVLTSMVEHSRIVACLMNRKISIRQDAFAIASTYKEPYQKHPKPVNLHDHSAMHRGLYILSGILAAMILAGAAWELFCHKKPGTTIASDSGMENTTEMTVQQHPGEELKKDLEQGKRMLRQLHEYFEMLERKSLEKVY